MKIKYSPNSFDDLSKHERKYIQQSNASGKFIYLLIYYAAFGVSFAHIKINARTQWANLFKVLPKEKFYGNTSGVQLENVPI